MFNFFHLTLLLCVGVVIFCLLKGYFGKTLQRFTKILFNPSNIEYLVVIFFILALLYYFTIYGISFEYCIDENTEKKLLETAKTGLETAKNANPSVSNTINLQTQSVNVNVPHNILNNIGLGGTVLGGMKIGSTFIKGGSPLAKAGFAIGGGVAAGAIHTVYSSMNKITNSNITNTSSNGKNGPYNASSVAENTSDLLNLQDILNILDGYLILSIVIIYLLFTLVIFFLGNFFTFNEINLNVIKKIPFGNSIVSVLKILVKY